MPPTISLAQFNRIASGTYNAGQIDFATGKNGATELVKVNNLWFTSRNNVQLSPGRVLEVKEAFIAALRDEAVLGRQELNKIRAELGVPAELDSTDSTQMTKLAQARFTPLTRAQVRTILDKYAAGGHGFTQLSHGRISAEEDAAAQRTAQAGAWKVSRRDAVNAAAPSADASAAHDMLDAASFLTGAKSLKDIHAARLQRTEALDRNAVTRQMGASFDKLFQGVLALLPRDVRESPGFSVCGTPVKLVKEKDGKLSAVLGRGRSATTVKLGVDARTYAKQLVDRAAAGQSAIGSDAMLRTFLWARASRVTGDDAIGDVAVSDDAGSPPVAPAQGSVNVDETVYKLKWKCKNGIQKTHRIAG